MSTGPIVFSHPIEILSLSRARRRDLGPDCSDPVCIFSFRPDPEESLDSVTIMLTQEQCVRLRDTLHRFLNDKESWLYLPKTQQRTLKS